MTNPHASVLPVRSPADLLALVPYLIGYPPPTDSLLAVALDGARIIFAARIDLPTVPNSEEHSQQEHSTAASDDQASDAEAYEIAATLAGVTGRQNPSSVVLVGYGTRDRVLPMLEVAIGVFAEAGLSVRLALRVSDGRFFHDNCPDGCPPEGTAFDPASSPAAAYAVYAGRVALPDRAAFVARLAPVDGPEREAMEQATTRAARRMAHLLDRVTTNPNTLDEVGRAAIRDALDRHQQGGRLSDDEAALLTVLLVHIPIRDQAWSLTDGSAPQISLWSDLTRRARPDLVAAPASLLAFAAWRAGDGTLATLALNRALRADPGYRMAQLLYQALQAGMPPSALDGWPA
jgi:hypothetical protein